MKLKYCVYLTIYSGNKLPPFYIGSSSTGTVKNGYRGSVGSKKYRDVWQSEIQDNPQLFKTKIVSYCETRRDAYEKELKLLQKLNCRENDLYMNQPIAGISNLTKYVSEKGKTDWNKKYGKQTADRMRKDASQKQKERWQNPEYVKLVSEAAADNWKNPALAERMKKRTNVEGYRAAALKRWSDPATREKIRQSMKGKKKTKRSISTT